mgnify:CR=1 FL=1|tara:strand:- start:12109 stop:13566 length:1458 start_codon:yes stop_codon:yes gene_type:complete
MQNLKRTVLIVEDSTAFSSAIEAAFSVKHDYEILIANTYAQTVELYQKHKDSIFAAITDLVLPDAEDGDAVKMLTLEGVPCIAFTGNFSPKLRIEILSWGVSDYILKIGQQDIDYVVDSIHRLDVNRTMKVLIVDDAPSSRAYLSEVLQKQCFQVDSVASAREALAMIESGYQARIVLIDLIMEDIDGIELLTSLRTNYDSTQMAIIGISGLASSDLIAKFMKYGGNDFLFKPFEHEQVVCRVNSNAHTQEQFDHLNRLNVQKNELLGMAAHDIRGPLGVVMSCGSMLKKEVNSEQGILLLDLLVEAADDMEELLNSILDISAVEHATIKMTATKINLTSLLVQLVEKMQLIADNKQQHLILSSSLDEVWINADEARIQEVLRNIISNAINYSPFGKTIEINSSFNQTKVRIQVIDEAGGVLENERHLLFKPFSKLSSKTTGGERSTGLGLAICKRIIDQHQGTISYEPNKNIGSIFKVVLPVFQ